MLILRVLLVGIILTCSIEVKAEFTSMNKNLGNGQINSLINSPTTFIAKEIQDSYKFYGLASYYNNVNYYIIDKESFQKVDPDKTAKLGQDQWLAVVGHLKVLLIKAKGLSMYLDKSKMVIDNPEMLSQPDVVIKIVIKTDLKSIAPELEQIRYTHLWGGLGWLSKLVESSLVAIQAHIVSNWGLAIIVFGILIKVLLLPVSVMIVHFQRKVSQVQAKLAPILEEIKATCSGEEAHDRLMIAHKDMGVSPFYTLKPMIGTMIQIPVLIAIFNALGEMPQFESQKFFWIENLAHPDAIRRMTFCIPLLGDNVSLLPFIMTIVTLFSTVIYQNPHAPEAEVKRQKHNLYLMSAAFLVLFYPFPAVMVLFWVVANILQTVQQQIFRI